MILNDEYYIEKAIEEAEKAVRIKEVPVGCVIVRDGEIIAAAHNRRETTQNALYHAEIAAIDIACKKTGFWRLSDCDIYVTLEPCAMCYGAMVNSRIRRVIFGAYDRKSGVLGSVIDLSSYAFNHTPLIVSGILQEKCGAILTEFFTGLRGH